MAYDVTGPDGVRVRVGSEREARRRARELLGVERVTETPTERGWQLWPVGAAEDSDQVVDVVPVRRTT
jgi:hypothetical protein